MGDNDETACQPLEHAQREGIDVPREERACCLIPTSPMDDPRRYPRYIVRARSGSTLQFHLPGDSIRGRHQTFDQAHWDAYLAAYDNRPQLTGTAQLVALPETRGAGSTLPSRAEIVETWHLPTCHIEGTGDDARLVFDASRRWTWEIIGLKSPSEHANRAWRGFVQRTLMFFPIEHLEPTGYARAYFDFRIGETHLGPRGRIGDGGTTSAAPSRAILVAFAALNRWFQRDRDVPDDECALDDWYSLDAYEQHPDRVVGTMYHELGHRLRVRGLERSALPFKRYFCALAAGGYGGVTKGVVEGFSEAYRARLTGRACESDPFDTPTKNRYLGEIDAQIAEADRDIEEAQQRVDAATTDRARNAATRALNSRQRTRDQTQRLRDMVQETPAMDSPVTMERPADTTTVPGAPREPARTPGEAADYAMDDLGFPRVPSFAAARAAIVQHLRDHDDGHGGLSADAVRPP